MRISLEGLYKKGKARKRHEFATLLFFHNDTVMNVKEAKKERIIQKIKKEKMAELKKDVDAIIKVRCDFYRRHHFFTRCLYVRNGIEVSWRDLNYPDGEKVVGVVFTIINEKGEKSDWRLTCFCAREVDPNISDAELEPKRHVEEEWQKILEEVERRRREGLI